MDVRGYGSPAKPEPSSGNQTSKDGKDQQLDHQGQDTCRGKQKTQLNQHARECQAKNRYPKHTKPPMS